VRTWTGVARAGDANAPSLFDAMRAEAEKVEERKKAWVEKLSKAAKEEAAAEAAAAAQAPAEAKGAAQAAAQAGTSQQ